MLHRRGAPESPSEARFRLLGARRQTLRRVGDRSLLAGYRDLVMSILTATTLSLSLALGPAGTVASPGEAPAGEVAASPATAEGPVRVEIRVGTTSYQGNSVTEGLDTRVERTVREVLKERGMQPADGAGDVTLEVIVAPHADEGYSSNVVARKDGAEIQGTRREQLICELCTEGELLEQLRGTIAELIEPMETAGRQSEEAPPPPPPRRPRTRRRSSARPRPRRRRARSPGSRRPASPPS